MGSFREEQMTPEDKELQKAEQRGFTQGQAWACAIMLRHEMSADRLLAESGLTAKIMKDAGVDDYDARPIKDSLRSIKRNKL